MVNGQAPPMMEPQHSPHGLPHGHPNYPPMESDGESSPHTPALQGHPQQKGKTIRAAGATVSGMVTQVAGFVDNKVLQAGQARVESAVPKAPIKVGAGHMNVAKGVNTAAKGAVTVTGVVVDGFLGAAKSVGGVFASNTKEPGTIKQYTQATVDAINDVQQAARSGTQRVVNTGVSQSQQYFGKVYGDDAAELAGQYGSAAKNATRAGLNVTKLTPTNFVKTATKSAVKGAAGVPTPSQRPVPPPVQVPPHHAHPAHPQSAPAQQQYYGSPQHAAGGYHGSPQHAAGGYHGSPQHGAAMGYQHHAAPSAPPPSGSAQQQNFAPTVPGAAYPPPPVMQGAQSGYPPPPPRA